jgi:hypothetical protein
MIGELPISQTRVEVRQPSGNDDLLLLECPSLDVRLALELVGRVASEPGGGEPRWAALPVPDLDALLLLVRRTVFGDLLRGIAACPDERCGAPVEIRFEIGDYLEHHRPRRPRNVEADAEPGWFRVDGGPVRFRLPTVADLIAATGTRRPEHSLAGACIRSGGAPGGLRRRVEQAMEALAPPLADEITGVCPECTAPIATDFDPLRYVLLELHDQAAFVLEDVHTLGLAYHWSEAEILGLPRSRRRRYAELALSALRAS